jgi:hypothetical protein
LAKINAERAREERLIEQRSRILAEKRRIYEEQRM